MVTKATYGLLPAGPADGDLAIAAGVLYRAADGFWLPQVDDLDTYALLETAGGDPALIDTVAGDDVASLTAAGWTDNSTGGVVSDAVVGDDAVIDFASTAGQAALDLVPSAWPDVLLVLCEARLVTANATSRNAAALISLRDGARQVWATLNRDNTGQTGWAQTFSAVAGNGSLAQDDFERLFFVVRRAGAGLCEMRQTTHAPFAGALFPGSFATTAENAIRLLTASQAGNRWQLRRLAVWGVS